ncbi:unnamed protein product [Gadus morhua 'NCC']
MRQTGQEGLDDKQTSDHEVGRPLDYALEMLLHGRWGQPPLPNSLLPRLCKSGCAMRQTGQEGLDDKQTSDHEV